MMMGGLRVLIRGDTSLHGLASLLEAVLLPPVPGLCRDWMRFLLVEADTEDTEVLLEVGGGIMRLSPVALLDLTMLGLCSLLTRGLGISGKCLEAGAGVRAGAGAG